MKRLWTDIRMAARSLRRSPTFALAALLALTLGIGANAALFSVLHAVVLRPLPFARPAELVMLWTTPVEEEADDPVVPADFLDWRRDARNFDELAGFFPFLTLDLLNGERAEQVTATSVTGNFFDVLGVEAGQGRVFSAAEDEAASGKVAVLSHRLWQQMFASDPAALGRSLRFNGEPYTVIGVMPASFDFPRDAELWVRAPGDVPQLSTSMPLDRLLRLRYMRAFGRLAPGVSLGQAQTEMSAIGRQLEVVRPDKNAGRTIRVVSLHEELVGNVRPALLVLMSLVSFVLLIACVNAASLLLARAASREREIAVRLALGAGRGAIVRQLVAESLLLSLLAGLLGLLLARALLALLVRFEWGGLPRLQEIGLDLTVLLYTLGLSLATGLLFGLMPALQTFRTQLVTALKEGANQVAESLRRGSLRYALLVLEVALAVVLLVGSGLLLRSFVALQSAELGFQPEDLLVFQIGLGGARYAEDPQVTAFYRELLERVEALPGVESAATVLHLPFPGDMLGGPLFVEGRPVPPESEQRDEMRQAVSPGYFETLRIPVVRGRAFTESDGAAAPRVAVISDELAARYFGTADPVGRRISRQDPSDEDPEWFRIVGVVGSTRHFNRQEPLQAEVFFPFEQWVWQRMDVVVRATGEPASVLPAVRQVVRGLDPELPIARVGTLEERIAEASAQPRFTLFVASLFGILATVLAALGIYGLVSYSVAQRRNEMGLRMALGAQRADIMSGVIRKSLQPVLVGVAVGLLVAWMLRELLARVLYEISATDPLIYVLVAAGSVAVAVAAMLLPAWRSARTSPLAALRSG